MLLAINNLIQSYFILKNNQFKIILIIYVYVRMDML